MPSHDYAITVAGTNIKTTLGIRHAVFMKYTTAQKRDGNIVLPYKHGELYVPDKYFEGADVLLQVYLPFDTTSEAAQALSDLALLFASPSEVVVAQNDPAKGNIRARVENLQDPVPTEDRFTYLFSLRNASGFWEDVTATEVGPGNPPAITTGGDRPIDDMIITLAGPGFFQHVDPLGQSSQVEIDAAAGAGTYVIDVGLGTVSKGGTNQDEFLIVDQPWWMKWEPNTALTLASDVNVSVSYRNKWA